MDEASIKTLLEMILEIQRRQLDSTEKFVTAVREFTMQVTELRLGLIRLDNYLVRNSLPEAQKAG